MNFVFRVNDVQLCLWYVLFHRSTEEISSKLALVWMTKEQNGGKKVRESSRD